MHGDQVRNDMAMRYMGCAPRCGYCLKASMTGRGDGVGVFRFLALLGMTRVIPVFVDSRLRGNDGPRLGCLFHPLLPCQALGQALIPLPSRERGLWRLVWLVVALLCGYCLKASMTV